VKEPVAGLTQADVEKILTDRDSGYAAVLGLTTTLATKHLRDFNEVLDVNALIDFSRKHRVALYDPRAEQDAYRALHGEQLTKKANDEEQARVDKLVNERLAERLKASPQPFPVRGAEPSALDALEQTDRSTRYTADSAAALYERLTTEAGNRA